MSALLLACVVSGGVYAQPLSLVSSHDLIVPFGIEGASVSPDGRWFVGTARANDVLVVADIATNTVVRRFHLPYLSFRSFAYPTSLRDPPFRWDPQSKFVWSADVGAVVLGGYPVGALLPAQAVIGNPQNNPVGPDRRDGPPTDALTRLPTFEHPGGLMDGLLWAGDRGRAVVLFGSKPSVWRADERTARPTFAMVDVNDGRMLAIQPIADAIAPLLAEGDLIDRISVLSGEAVVLPDGRIRLWAGVSARLNNGNKKSVGTWIVWTQGEHPRLLPAPSWPGPLRGEVRYSMTPDGTKVLATFPLGPPMVCIEPSSGCRVTGPPVEGPLIVAYDLSTGAVVWTFRAWAAAPDNRRAAAIHPEGRIALVQLAVFWAVGVLDMATGELLQALPGGPELTYGFFGQSGRCAFVQFPDRLQVYQVETTASNVPSRCGPPGSTH